MLRTRPALSPAIHQTAQPSVLLRPSDRGAATYIAPDSSDATERLSFAKGMVTVRSTKGVVLPFPYRTRGTENCRRATYLI